MLFSFAFDDHWTLAKVRVLCPLWPVCFIIYFFYILHAEILSAVIMRCPSSSLLWGELISPPFVLQAIRLSLEQALPPEPSEDSGKQISKLRIRTPSGEFLERRFLGSCKLQVLFDFVASKGYPFEEFKLLTTFPRRNVSSHSPKKAKHTYTVITASAGAALFFVTVESLLWNTDLSDLCDSWNIN